MTGECLEQREKKARCLCVCGGGWVGKEMGRKIPSKCLAERLEPGRDASHPCRTGRAKRGLGDPKDRRAKGGENQEEEEEDEGSEKQQEDKAGVKRLLCRKVRKNKD